MDPKEIRELIEMISRSDFSTFELEGEGFRLKLVRKAGRVAVVEPEPAVLAAKSEPPVAEPPPASPAPPTEPESADGIVELKSPIVGTFYRAPSPDSPPFVEVGSKVKKGQVICVVEAMKLMNEIESEIDAEVVEVAVANGQPVEYGEVLFRLRPVH